MRTQTVGRVERRAPAAPCSDPLKASFERRATEFAAAAQRVRVGADHEAIHDLRVAARRLVATLRVWRDLVPARARRAAERGLRRLRRRIGGARELEVHVALLEEQLPAGGGATGSVAAEVLERLRERLARRRRSAARRVSPRRLKRVLRRLGTAGAGLGAPQPGGPGALPGVLAVERRLADQATAAVRSASEHPDDASLHGARVLVKKWRYTIECLDEVVPGAAGQAVRPLRRIQGDLGDAHDRAMLRELLERHARRAGSAGESDELRPLIERLDLERERAVRRFRRLAGTLVGHSRDGARDAARDAALKPAAGGSVEVPAIPLESTADAGHEAAGAPCGREDPRDERWDHMAAWLARSGRPR